MNSSDNGASKRPTATYRTFPVAAGRATTEVCDRYIRAIVVEIFPVYVTKLYPAICLLNHDAVAGNPRAVMAILAIKKPGHSKLKVHST